MLAIHDRNCMCWRRGLNDLWPIKKAYRKKLNAGCSSASIVLLAAEIDRSFSLEHHFPDFQNVHQH